MSEREKKEKRKGKEKEREQQGSRKRVLAAHVIYFPEHANLLLSTQRALGFREVEGEWMEMSAPSPHLREVLAMLEDALKYV